MSCEVSWIFIISICLTNAFARSLNHIHFDVAPMNLPKSFPPLPKSLDLIDEEENFWINPRQEPTKLGHSSKHYEGGSSLIENLNKPQSSIINPQMSLNFETFPTWFELPKSSSKNGPKTGKITEETKLVDPKNLDSKSKIQDHQEKITILALPLSDNKASSGVKIQELSEKNTNSEKSLGVEKIFSMGKTAESKADLDISDFIILNELSEKLNEKSTPVQPQQGDLIPKKKVKLFSPIYASGLDILKAPYSKGGFSMNKQKHSPLQNIQTNGNREKDLDFEENEIKIQPKEHFGFGNKNPTFVFNDLKKIPINHFPQTLGNTFKSKGSVDDPRFPSLKPSLTMTSIFLSPAQSHFEDVGSFDSLKLHDEDPDSNAIKMNFRTAVKPLLKKDFISDNKLESSMHISNELNPDMKQIHDLNPALMKMNMSINILDENANKVDKEKDGSKPKIEIEKLSKKPEDCDEETMNKYPWYQFLENFSDKILGAAMKYEIAIKHGQESSNRFEVLK